MAPGERSIFEELNPPRGFGLEDNAPRSSHNIPVHNEAPLYQVWLQKFKRFRRYRPEIFRTHGKTDKMIPIPPTKFITGAEGGVGMKHYVVAYLCFSYMPTSKLLQQLCEPVSRAQTESGNSSS